MSISAEKLRRMFEEGLGKRLLSIKNVVGYSTTPKKKIKNGIETDIDCIRVYVKRKVPKLELKAEDTIPESVGGMPTDVVEIGELRALAYTQRMRPCPPGYSIGEKSITAGCIPAGYKVLSNPGFKDISEIELGDKVYTTNGWEKAQWVGARPCKERELVEIKPWYLPAIRFTPNHPILVSEKKYNGHWLVGHSELKWKESKDVKKTDYVVVPRIPIDRPTSNISPKFAEFLGFFVAEGSTSIDRSRKQYRVRIGVKKETDIANELENVVREFFPHITVNKNKKNGMIEFTIYSKELVLRLQSMCGVSAGTKYVPEPVLRGNKEVIKAFLKGLELGDGWFETREGRKTHHFDTISERLAREVQLLWNKMGYIASLRQRTVKERVIDGRLLPETTCYEICVNENSKHYYRLESGKFLVSIKEVKTIPFDGVVYNFSTPSENYCVPFVVHNTFGCVVKDNQSGENWILSNNHVLAAENKAPIGSEILQPGAYDGGTVANDTIAKLARFVTVNIGGPSGCTLSRAVVGFLNGLSIALGRKTRFRAVVEQLSNDVDCAAARPINQADILLDVKDIGKPSGTAEAQVGDECHKTGRCFAKDTLILTNPEGPKTVDELEVGDKVVCYNEAEGKIEAHPIVDIISQGIRDVYRIKTRNKMVEVTDNHPFLVAENKGRVKKPVSVHLDSGDIVQYKFNDWALRWKELGELRRGDTIVALHHFDGSEGGEIGEECARLLGFIVGDGSVGRDIRLYCTSSEEAKKYGQLLMKLFPEPTVERRCTRCFHSYISHANAKDPICNDCGSHYSKVTRRFLRGGGTTKRGKVYVVIYSSKAAATQLGKHIHGKKLERRIPKAIWSLPIISKRAFIEGYCDADGHRATHYSSGHTRKYCFQSPNERLIKEIRELCVSCGIRVTNILSRMKNGYQPKVNWEFTAYPDSDSRRMSKLARPKGLCISKSGWLYRSIRLPEELQFESVMGIQKIGPKETYDIEVEGSHNFIGNGILLHNTTMHTHLKVTDVDFTGNVQYSSGVALFVDQIVAQGIGGAGSAGGDSGSAVFLASGNGTTLTGLLFAGSDTQNITIINKIKNVFRELGVSLAT